MANEQVFEMKSISSMEWDEFVIESVANWRNYANKVINEVENLETKQIKLLCYFSLMESIAQDIGNYPLKGQQNAFTSFVIKYQKGYDFLEMIDPVTLYYHYEDQLKEDSNLDSLEDATYYYADSKKIRELADEMSKKINDQNLTGKHRYVDLLYRIRCMISHEFSESYTKNHRFLKRPYYINCSRYYVNENNEVVNDEVWQLIFPIIFIKELCINCINNYLDDCLNKKVLPLSNDSLKRFCQTTWYQK